MRGHDERAAAARRELVETAPPDAEALAELEHWLESLRSSPR